jgi:hypothetical protein
MFRVVVILLIVLQLKAVEVLPHLPGGMGMREAHPSQNTLLLTLRRRVNETRIVTVKNENFLIPLEEALRKDGCELSFSGLGESEAELALTIYCGMLNNRPRQKVSTRTPLPAMEETRRFLRDQYAYKVKRLEYLSEMMHPAYWYGNYDTLDTVLHHYFEGKKGKKKSATSSQYKGKYVEMPAPWGLDRIDMHYGLLDNEYHYLNLGTPIDIYIMDTGIRVSHTDFQGRAHFLSNTVGDGINTDCAGHGTMVASLAGGAKYGVAKGASLWGVKVLDCGGMGDSFTIVTGVMAVQEHALTRRSLGHRAVASLSLGGEPSMAMDDAMLSLLGSGINVVVAAGNEYANACSYSPARLGGSSNVLTVGASTIQDSRPPFSNVGKCVSISAPGVNISGAWFTSDTSTVTLSGTSMATPYVSGVLSLVLAQNLALTVPQANAIVQRWATPKVVTGACPFIGVCNGSNLLYSLIVWNATPNLPPPTPTGPPSRSPPTYAPKRPLPGEDELSSSGRGTLHNILLVMALFVLSWTWS